jgi:RNA polymerase sigma-70 factor, ECF subfamily
LRATRIIRSSPSEAVLQGKLDNARPRVGCRNGGESSRDKPVVIRLREIHQVDAMRKRRMFSLDSNDDDGIRIAPASDEPSPFTLAARTEDAERLARSLQTLEPVFREALVLRFQEDFSLQEISAIVGAPVSTVASRIYRGLATLRPQFKGETA